MDSCEWELENEDANSWKSKCGHSFWFEEGSPTDNEMKFCPYCGKTLTIQENKCFVCEGRGYIWNEYSLQDEPCSECNKYDLQNQ